MAALTRARSSWASSDTPDNTEWKKLSSNRAAAINATLGGAYAPSTLLTINGLGINVYAPTILSGADATLTTASGGRIELQGAVDWPELGATHPGRAQTRVTSFLKARPSPWYAARPRVDDSVEGIQTTALGFYDVPTNASITPTLSLPLEILDGSQLLRATFSLRVMTPRTALPVAPPQMRVVAIDNFGEETPLSIGLLVDGAVVATADANGWVSMPTPATVSAYYANGASQTVELQLDVNHVVDIGEFTYFAEVTEETAQPAAPWRLFVMPEVSTVFTTNNAQNTNLSGAIVLCIGQTAPEQNGVFTSSAAVAWSRVPPIVAGDPVPVAMAGYLVPVKETGSGGTSIYNYGPSLFQMVTPLPVVVGTDPETFVTEGDASAQFVAIGNLYERVAVDMAVVDLRYGQS